MRQLLALAFVPVKDVIKYFHELLMQQFYIENINLLQPLIDYFEDTWIERANRYGQRRKPMFCLEY